MSDADERHARFLALLQPERDALWRFARRNCWDANAAEDVLQDAVLVAWRRFDTFQPGTSFRAWAFKILSLTILNANGQLARDLRRTRVTEHMDVLAALQREEAYEKILDDPERVLQRVPDALRRAVKSLQPAERMVFLLRAAENMAYKDIARTLDIPIGTVMSHLFRARARLRERLADALASGEVQEPRTA